MKLEKLFQKIICLQFIIVLVFFILYLTIIRLKKKKIETVHDELFSDEKCTVLSSTSVFELNFNSRSL